MKKHLLLFAAAVMLLGAGCLAEVPPSDDDLTMPPPKPANVTYRDGTLGFSVQHPRSLTVLTDKAQMASSGYIPACDPSTAVACFLIPQSDYPGTNFDSAGLAVNVIAAAKSEKDCLAPAGNVQGSASTDINGQTFATFKAGDAAMSHRSDGMEYLAFHKGTCFDLTTRTNTTVFEVYAPGTIKQFTGAQDAAVQKQLDAMVKSFRFAP